MPHLTPNLLHSNPQEIRAFSFAGSKLVKEDVEKLKLAINLEKLDLSNTEITDEDVPYLADTLQHLTSLAFLNLSGNGLSFMSDHKSISQESAETLAKTLSALPNLTSLDLSSSLHNRGWVFEFASHLQHLPNLTSLSFSDDLICSFTASALADSLPNLANLASLNLSGSEMDSETVMLLAPGIQRLSKLSHLNLSDSFEFGISIESVVSIIENLPSLTSLNLSGCFLPGEEVRQNSDSAIKINAQYPNLTLDFSIARVAPESAEKKAKYDRMVEEKMKEAILHTSHDKGGNFIPRQRFYHKEENFEDAHLFDKNQRLEVLNHPSIQYKIIKPFLKAHFEGVSDATIEILSFCDAKSLGRLKMTAKKFGNTECDDSHKCNSHWLKLFEGSSDAANIYQEEALELSGGGTSTFED